MNKRLLKKLMRYFYNMFFRRTIYSLNIPVRLNVGKKTKIEEGCVCDNKSVIGKYCYIGHNSLITSSFIGNYCSIGPNVKVGLGEHDINKISTNSIFLSSPREYLTHKECKVGNDVWIGAGSIILRDVHIGDGAVIGANSVVTKDIPPYCVAVGIPARVLKFRFNEGKIEAILKSKWWELDYWDAKTVIDQLSEKLRE